MLYGEEKLREMARSILPSSRRKASRKDKALCKRGARRQARQNLGRAFLDGEDNEIVDRVDPTYYPEHEIRQLVRERQYGDKINHFQKWAVAFTKDLEDPGARMARMKKILPDNLIGWHARSHLRFMEEFRTEPRFSWIYRREPTFAQDLIVRVLRKVVEDADLMRMFNNRMCISHTTVRWITGYGVPVIKKKTGYRWTGGTSVLGEVPYVEFEEKTEEKGSGPRLLKGTFDIEPFLEDLAKASKCHWQVPSPLWVKKTIQTVLDQEGNISHWSINEQRVRVRKNPDYHPEWLKGLHEFIRGYLETRGIVHKMRALGFV